MFFPSFKKINSIYSISIQCLICARSWKTKMAAWSSVFDEMHLHRQIKNKDRQKPRALGPQQKDWQTLPVGMRKDLTEALAFVLYSETGYKIFHQRRIEKTSPILETIKANHGVWNSCGWVTEYTKWESREPRLSCHSEISGEGTWRERHQCKGETHMGCLF